MLSVFVLCTVCCVYVVCVCFVYSMLCIGCGRVEYVHMFVVYYNIIVYVFSVSYIMCVLCVFYIIILLCIIIIVFCVVYIYPIMCVGCVSKH